MSYKNTQIEINMLHIICIGADEMQTNSNHVGSVAPLM